MKWLFAVLLLGCVERAAPQSVHGTSNPGVTVALLFEHDGCKVYRFVDGNAHYYVHCKSGESSAMEQHIESCGKDCSETVQTEIPTVEDHPGLKALCRDCPEK